MSRALALLLLAMTASGCRRDLCESEPASFQLEVSIMNAELARKASAMHVEVRTPTAGWQREIALGGLFQDQRTDFGIVLDPSPRESYMLDVRVQLLDGVGTVIAGGSRSLEVTADGCNTVDLMLEPVTISVDAGVDDAG